MYRLEGLVVCSYSVLFSVAPNIGSHAARMFALCLCASLTVHFCLPAVEVIGSFRGSVSVVPRGEIALSCNCIPKSFTKYVGNVYFNNR